MQGKVVEDIAPVNFFSFGRRDDVHAVASGDDFSTCQDLGFCALSFKTFVGVLVIQLQDDGGPEALNRFYVAAEGSDFNVSFERAQGWKLMRTRFLYRYVDGGDVAQLGVYAGDNGGEVFLQATAPGGTSGSIAQARPPCSGAGFSAARRGLGYAQLLGGTRQPSVVCPRALTDIVADYALKATTWNFQGATFGDNQLATTRLFVIDL
ncbi:MAG: hypothetical protein ABR505_01210 [Actinomycetota bacterium]